MYRPTNEPPVEDQSTIDAIAEARSELNKLNHALTTCTGTRALAPRPGLLPSIEEILKDAPPPIFPLDKDELEFIRMVSDCLRPCKVR
jgi:hypothetical protein